MNAAYTDIIFGPPGTGKTFDLLNTVDDALQSGVKPEEIVFISFTRKAANEAKERAITKFNLTDDKFPWFRTLHSLAFQQLGLNKSSVMTIRDYIKLCELLGLTISYKQYSEDGTFTGFTKGDRLFFTENMARQRQMSMKDYWELAPNEDIYYYELEQLHNTLVEYKRLNGKKDFTDIITEFVNLDAPIPSAKLLVVDEAQDLSLLQWGMVRKLASTIERVFIAGDDDQAIFRWAGADVDTFITLPGTRKILNQSFRVPPHIQELAKVVSNRISKRVDKQWSPRNTEHREVHYENDFTHLDMSKGTWLLLARNAYLLDEYTQFCIQQGFIFDSSVESPLRGDAYKAIRSWEDLRSGKKIFAVNAKIVYDFMTTRVGVEYGFKGKMDEVPDRDFVDFKTLREKYGLCYREDVTWITALDKMTDRERQYFIAANERGESWSEEPRIKISTIHSVKGGEADNVVLMTDMAGRTWFEFQENPDDEHRVWYVAITRAKEELFIITPRTNKCYDL